MFDGRCCLQGMSHLKIERRDSANTASAFRTAINTSKAHKSKKATGKATPESPHVWVGDVVTVRKAGHNQTESPLGSALSQTLGAEELSFLMKIRAPLCQISTEAGHTGDAGEGCCCCPHPSSWLQTHTKAADKRSSWPCHNRGHAHPTYQKVVGR